MGDVGNAGSECKNMECKQGASHCMLCCGVLIPRSRIQCDAPIQPLESRANLTN